MRYWLLLLLLPLTACQYHVGRGELTQSYSKVHIPYVDGDDTGQFTATLIRTMNTEGSLRCCSGRSELLLRVCLLPPGDVNIGFDYAPEPQDKKIVVSQEARLTLTARVSLIDCCKQCTLLGPIDITSFIDYDFEPDLSNVNDHALSLGQLEMHHLAQQAALTPLYALLSQKIVNYVNFGW